MGKPVYEISPMTSLTMLIDLAYSTYSRSPSHAGGGQRLACLPPQRITRSGVLNDFDPAPPLQVGPLQLGTTILPRLGECDPVQGECVSELPALRDVLAHQEVGDNTVAPRPISSRPLSRDCGSGHRRCDGRRRPAAWPPWKPLLPGRPWSHTI